MEKALFLDLDGTVRDTLPEVSRPYPHRPEEQYLLPDRKEKIWDYKKKGYRIIAVTNQGSIGMGKLKLKDCQDCLDDINKKLGGVFDKMYYAKAAPHTNDFMRKPNPGMLVHAATELDIDLEKSLMIGDRDSDKEAAERAGTDFKWAKDFFGS